MAIWQATNVSIPNNSSIITVNTGDDVGNLFTGAIVQVNNLQFMTVKTVNTGASPQTIEIDELYTGSNVSGGTAIGAPTQGAIKEAAEELRLLRTTYEGLADTVSTTGTANSLAKRTSAGRLKAADGSAVDDVVTVGQTGTVFDKDVTTSTTDITANRILKVADGGLLSTGNPPSIAAGTTIYPTMFGRDDDGSGGYPVFGFASTILNMRYNTNRQSQIGFSHGGDVRAVFRTMVSDSTWSDIYDLFGEHNANFTVFGDNGVGDRVAKATGRGSTTAFLELHLNSPTPPTGVIVTGTFRLVDSVGTTTLVNGLGQSSFSLSNAKPSSKLFTVLLSFASASVSKDLPMYLETASADAKIEVTF